MTAIGAAATMINDTGDEGMTEEAQELFMERLADFIKLLCETQYQQSQTRRAFIIPRFPKDMQTIIKKTIPDKFLFGRDFTTKIKESKESDKLFKSATDASQQKTFKTYQLGNADRSSGAGPSPRASGFHARGQGRPRWFSRKPDSRERNPRQSYHKKEKKYR